MSLEQISSVLGSDTAELFYRKLTDTKYLVQKSLTSAQKSTADGLPHLGGGFFSFPMVLQCSAQYFPLRNPSGAPMGVLTLCSVSQGAVKAPLVQSSSWKFPANVRVRSELKVQPSDMRMDIWWSSAVTTGNKYHFGNPVGL